MSGSIDVMLVSCPGFTLHHHPCHHVQSNKQQQHPCRQSVDMAAAGWHTCMPLVVRVWLQSREVPTTGSAAARTLEGVVLLEYRLHLTTQQKDVQCQQIVWK
jgi:hypothetical protein